MIRAGSVRWIVFRQEWLQLLRDGRFVVGGGLLLLLGLASCILAQLEYQTDMETAVRNNETARAHWLQQDAKNPHGAAHYGVYVFQQPDAASLFDPGVLPFAGRTAFVEAHHKNDSTAQEARVRGSLARFGNLSPAFFLIWLVPLVVILLNFGGIAGERASGLLKIVASTGVSPRAWLLGKWLAAVSPALLSVAGVMALSLLLAGGADPVLWSLKALGFLLYLGTVVNITLGISARVRSSGTALLVLIALWMLGTLVLPRLAANLAEEKFPTPLEHRFKGRIAALKKDRIETHLEQLKRETLIQYEVADVSALPINYNALVMQADEDFTDKIYDSFYAELYENQRRQLSVYRAFSVLWPMIPVRFLSMGLSRSDMFAHHHFNQEAETYRRQFVKNLNHNMMNHSRTGEWDYQAPPTTWAQVPAFQHVPRPRFAVLRDNLPDLAVLVAWFGISALWLRRTALSVFRSES